MLRLIGQFPLVRRQVPSTPSEKAKLSYWFAVFVCYFIASLIGIIIALTSGCATSMKATVIFVGFAIDLLRWQFAPELQLSQCERELSFRRAFEDNNYHSRCQKRFIVFTGSIYLAWIVFTSLSLYLYLAQGYEIPIFSLPLDPFLRSLSVLENTFLDPMRTSFAQSFFSVTWCFMLISIVTEISGGIFYASHWPARNKMSESNKTFLRNRHKVMKLILIIIGVGGSYCLIGNFEFFRSGASKISGLSMSWQPVTTGHFAYLVILGGLSLMSTAAAIGALYSYFLMQMSGGAALATTLLSSISNRLQIGRL